MCGRRRRLLDLGWGGGEGEGRGRKRGGGRGLGGAVVRREIGTVWDFFCYGGYVLLLSAIAILSFLMVEQR